MKKAVFIITFFAFALMAQSQTEWVIDNAHTSVKFDVTHMVISEVTGEFKSFSGKVISRKDDFSDLQVEFTIDAGSVNTDNTNRDNELKSDDFFNVAKFPNITFKSTSFTKIEGNKYFLEGDLTIRDVTKRIKFLVVYNGTVKDMKGNPKAGFKATGSIDRFDYKLTWNKMVEAGPVVSKDVNFTINIEVGKK